MSKFVYEAVTSDGQLTRGDVTAMAEREAVIKLQRRGLTPLRVAAAESFVGKTIMEGAASLPNNTAAHKTVVNKRPGGKGYKAKVAALFAKTPSLPFGGVKARDLITFSENLAVLLEAGITVDKALDILVELAPGKRFGLVVSDLRDKVREGNSLAEAMEQHASVFPPVFSGMIKAGESGGILESVLRRLSGYLASVQGIKEYLLSAMIYPSILALASAGSIVVMLTFVIPKFSVIFSDMGVALPFSTRVMLAMGNFLQAWWWTLLAALVGGVVAFRYAISTSAGRRVIDTVKLAIPLVGSLLVKIEVSRLSSTLGTMLENGAPMLSSLNMSRNVVLNSVVRNDLEKVYTDVKEGALVSTALSKIAYFPSLAVHMISVGEETGRLDVMLNKVADLYEKDLRSAIKSVTSILEPLIILTMGLVIGGMVVSMLLAIFSVNDMGF